MGKRRRVSSEKRNGEKSKSNLKSIRNHHHVDAEYTLHLAELSSRELNEPFSSLNIGIKLNYSSMVCWVVFFRQVANS